MIINILEDKFYNQLDNICQNALTSTAFMESQRIGLSGLLGEKTESKFPNIIREPNHCSKEFIRKELLKINRHINTHCLNNEDVVIYLEEKNKEYFRDFEAERLTKDTELFPNILGHWPKKYNANYIALREYISEVLFEIERLSYKKEPISIKSEPELLETNSFFEMVFNGELGDLEIYNYVQKVTSNHEIGKLRLLNRDLDFYVFCKREEIEGSFSSDEIKEKIEKNISKGIEVPYMKIKPHESFKNQLDDKEYKFLDLEKLMYPHDFFSIYGLSNLLLSLIKNKNQPQQNSPNSNSQNTQIKLSDKKEIEEPNSWIKHLEFLKGENNSKEKIMEDDDYNTLISKIEFLIKNNKVPPFDKPQKKINISNQSLIYTFRLLHKELYGTSKIKDFFIDFLKIYFLQLSNYNSLREQFSKQKPKLYPF